MIHEHTSYCSIIELIKKIDNTVKILCKYLKYKCYLCYYTAVI